MAYQVVRSSHSILIFGEETPMPNAQVVLRQLLRYGLPVLAVSAAGSFVLLSGNTYNFDMFNNWFNTNHHYSPDESQPTDTPIPELGPDSQIPDINIELSPISIDPEFNITTPITVDPEVNISPELNFNPGIDLQFNPELSPEITVSPTLEFNPAFNSEFGFSPSLEFAPEVIASPSFQTNLERSVVLTNSDSTPTEATVPEGQPSVPAAVPNNPIQSPVPAIVLDNPAQRPVSEVLPESSGQPPTLLAEEELGSPPNEPGFSFQLPTDEVQPIPGYSTIPFDSEEIDPNLSPQPPVRKILSPRSEDLPTTSTPGRLPYSITPSDRSVDISEPGTVMAIVLFGLGLFGFESRRATLSVRPVQNR